MQPAVRACPDFVAVVTVVVTAVVAITVSAISLGAIALGTTSLGGRSPDEGRPVTATAHEVTPAATVTFGAIPEAIIRNQFLYCGLICPYLIQGAVTVPRAAIESPGVFLSAYDRTRSVPAAVGVAAQSVTRPAHAAMTGIIVNDLTLVLPRAQNALTVAVVEALNVMDAATAPDEPEPLLAAGQAFETGRGRILDALNRPITPNPAPTAIATTAPQVAAVEGINTASAVLFGAPELLLLGVTETADAAAAELATTGDVEAARTVAQEHTAAWVDQAEQVILEAND